MAGYVNNFKFPRDTSANGNHDGAVALTMFKKTLLCVTAVLVRRAADLQLMLCMPWLCSTFAVPATHQEIGWSLWHSSSSCFMNRIAAQGGTFLQCGLHPVPSLLSSQTWLPPH